MHIRSTALLAAFLPALASAAPAWKVVFINSYHQGYEWSDGEEAGAVETLKASGVAVAVFRLDAKRNPDEVDVKKAALDAKAFIERERPHAVIVADDQAVKYLLEPYFKNARIPFVFCGVNWNASKYGLPYHNATGMVEVNLAKPLVQMLRGYAKGDRVGFLAGDSDTAHIDTKVYKERLGLRIAAERYVKTMEDWKAAYASLQDEVDILFLGVYAGIGDWSAAEAAQWSSAHAKIPVGTVHDYMAPYAEVGMVKMAREQGTWAAKTALAILKGAAPSSIPISENKESKLFLNVKLASKLGIVFPPELVRTAEFVK